MPTTITTTREHAAYDLDDEFSETIHQFHIAQAVKALATEIEMTTQPRYYDEFLNIEVIIE